MEKFNYSAYFGPIRSLADALREGPSRFWEPGQEELGKPHDYVLYLGCNVLRTPHLAQSMVAILQAMGVDFLTLGGSAHCCGVVHQRVGDGDIGLRVGQTTLNRFARVRPKAVLTYCPTCNTVFDDKLASGDLASDVPYRHVTQFIAENLDKLVFTTSVPRRIGLHMHVGTARARQDSDHVMSILRRIPDLDVVELPAAEEWSYACSAAIVSGPGGKGLHQRVGEMFRAAGELGCDGIATVYHSCYRDLIPAERAFGLPLMNYAEIVVQALGADPFPARYKELAQSADPDAAYEALAPRALDRGVDPDGLRNTVDLHFRPGAAPLDLSRYMEEATDDRS